MNEKDLIDSLDRIASQDIGDTINKWPEIQARILGRSAQHTRHTLRFALPLALAAVLLISAAAYACQRILTGDPGMQGVQEAGMVQTLNITARPPEREGTPTAVVEKAAAVLQTPALSVNPTPSLEMIQNKQDVTVTLESIYVDTGRVVLRVRVAGGKNHPGFGPSIWLMDGQGRFFSYRSFQWVGPSPDAEEFEYEGCFYPQIGYQDENGESRIINNYLSTVNGQIDLKLVVWMTPVGDSLTGAEEQLKAIPTVPGVVGPFEFNVNARVYPENVIDVQQTQTAGGQKITLEQVSISPSRTTVRLCFDLPDQQDWQLKVGLERSGAAGQPDGWSMIGLPTHADTRHCADYYFNMFSPEQAGTLKVTVVRMRVGEPEAVEFWQQVIDRLAQEGIQAELVVDHSFKINVLEKPDGMTDEQVDQRIETIQGELRAEVKGPWVFEVENR